MAEERQRLYGQWRVILIACLMIRGMAVENQGKEGAGRTADNAHSPKAARRPRYKGRAHKSSWAQKIEAGKDQKTGVGHSLSQAQDKSSAGDYDQSHPTSSWAYHRKIEAERNQKTDVGQWPIQDQDKSSASAQSFQSSDVMSSSVLQAVIIEPTQAAMEQYMSKILEVKKSTYSDAPVQESMPPVPQAEQEVGSSLIEAMFSHMRSGLEDDSAAISKDKGLLGQMLDATPRMFNNLNQALFMHKAVAKLREQIDMQLEKGLEQIEENGKKKTLTGELSRLTNTLLHILDGDTPGSSPGECTPGHDMVSDFLLREEAAIKGKEKKLLFKEPSLEFANFRSCAKSLPYEILEKGDIDQDKKSIELLRLYLFKLFPEAARKVFGKGKVDPCTIKTPFMTAGCAWKTDPSQDNLVRLAAEFIYHVRGGLSIFINGLGQASGKLKVRAALKTASSLVGSLNVEEFANQILTDLLPPGSKKDPEVPREWAPQPVLEPLRQAIVDVSNEGDLETKYAAILQDYESKAAEPGAYKRMSRKDKKAYAVQDKELEARWKTEVELPRQLLASKLTYLLGVTMRTREFETQFKAIIQDFATWALSTKDLKYQEIDASGGIVEKKIDLVPLECILDKKKCSRSSSALERLTDSSLKDMEEMSEYENSIVSSFNQEVDILAAGMWNDVRPPGRFRRGLAEGKQAVERVLDCYSRCENTCCECEFDLSDDCDKCCWTIVCFWNLWCLLGFLCTDRI
eukprot:gnl/MRDRNA2_/MRDRNA2_58068_c0_seq1.p1 gnl/MRDRNA2_/MRDRNA2_58068_c0~~gnl/MRDRNA2_/MRDRNA2_58068_c0_seq1.p1  ORF type:complete len:742 (+),score=130.86 gnl/MRDRNA2_/MRDRNA2_58068_c0_seq1:186-2411(+)